MTDRTLSTTVGSGPPGHAPDLDEALSARLRDLALVELDALLVGDRDLITAFADDVADALREARTRIATLRAQLGGADPLSALDIPTRQRASDAATAGVDRIRARLTSQADACRALARLADLAANLIPKLFEADRRR